MKRDRLLLTILRLVAIVVASAGVGFASLVVLDVLTSPSDFPSGPAGKTLFFAIGFVVAIVSGLLLLSSVDFPDPEAPISARPATKREHRDHEEKKPYG